MRWWVLLFLSIILGWSGLASARAPVQLQDPPPLPIPEKISQRDVARFVVQTLSSRAWGITKEEADHVIATMRRDRFMVRIRVSWDARTIRTAYMDSENLDYAIRDGQPYIHPGYPRWIDDLLFGFRTKMRVRSIENGGSGT